MLGKSWKVYGGGGKGTSVDSGEREGCLLRMFMGYKSANFQCTEKLKGDIHSKRNLISTQVRKSPQKKIEI